MKEKANHKEKGDHSGARFDLCTVYVPHKLHQQDRLLVDGGDLVFIRHVHF